jgi:hypothetical protein
VLESGESAHALAARAVCIQAGVLVSFAALGLGILALRSAGHALGLGHAAAAIRCVVGVLALRDAGGRLSMSGVVQFGASLGNTGSSLANRVRPGRRFLHRRAGGGGGQPVHGAVHGQRAGVRVRRADAVGAAGVPDARRRAGAAVSVDRFRARAGALAAATGRWMETLKQVLAFPMYLTAVWLVWVLAHQRGADAVGLVLVAMVLLAMTLWWFERSRHGRDQPRAGGRAGARHAGAAVSARPCAATVDAADGRGRRGRL